jgi:hypothetical protein
MYICASMKLKAKSENIKAIMGTKCAPRLADLFLYSYNGFLKEMISICELSIYM